MLFRRYRRKRSWLRHRQDFSWRERGKNPFFEKPKGLSVRQKILLSVFGVTIMTVVLVLFFHPFFAVQASHISVTGLERVDEKELKDTVVGIMSHRTAWVFPRNHYSLIEVEEIQEILLKRYPFASVTVKKIFPKRLEITVAETLSTIIYSAGDRYAYVDASGQVVELLRPAENDPWKGGASTTDDQFIRRTARMKAVWGDYPIIYDLQEREIAQNAQVLPKGIAQAILEFYPRLGEAGIFARYSVLDNPLGHASVVTEEGWKMLVIFDETIGKQLEKFLRLTKESIPDRRQIQYIDIRYGDRIFWQ